MGPSAPPAQKKRVTGGKPVHKRPGKENYQPYYVPADRASSGFPSISSAICYRSVKGRSTSSRLLALTVPHHDRFELWPLSRSTPYNDKFD
ncbi:hypothetical protein HBI82_177620 [Parastagonospora nodorum]|nr:hypothetical protein HBH91_003490 [Parastagonospora nodorum]KAH4967214.1 hypothetical protein HBI78_080030 [Parastagonospora nodorum]KAH5235439.1 hypothetical protein HBI62_003530 [Parastagonospora nodorum]KAH5995294.1 hypothetical protein HBI82_177620 [Parastagonospora nodorum]KAH6359488.1 hypothetical protein HBI36_072140 [Parastagonospora nodorum]